MVFAFWTGFKCCRTSLTMNCRRGAAYRKTKPPGAGSIRGRLACLIEFKGGQCQLTEETAAHSAVRQEAQKRRRFAVYLDADARLELPRSAPPSALANAE